MVMKKDFLVVGLLLFVSINFVSAVVITDDLHLNIQVLDSQGDVAVGTYAFVFNISTTSNCSSIVYTNSTTLATDSRGIISYYLRNVSLDYNNQYWICYYRDGSLINTSQIARVPYAFRAKNVTLSGVEVDQNLNMGSYNITAPYFIGDGRYLTNLNVSANSLGALTGAGTLGYLPMWNGTTSLNNSVIYQNGTNVGIGTTAPGTYHNRGTGVLAEISSADIPQLILHKTGTNESGAIININSNKDLVLNVKDGSSTSIDALTIDSTSGNVGIGTTSPNFKLDVDGTIRGTQIIANGSGSHPTNSGSYLELYMLGETARILPYNGTAYKDLAIGDWNSGNPNIMLKVGGSVGIGTGSPAAKLDVQTGTNNSVVASFGVDANNRVTIYDYAAGGFRSVYAVENGSYGSLNLGHGTSPYLFVKTGGNVGVGTSNPQEKLEVSGRINASTDVCITGGNCLSDSIMGGSETDPLWTANFTAYNSSWSSTYNASYVPYTGSNANVVLGDYNFSVGTSDFFVNANTGNVGIGTTSPTTSLHLNSTSPIFTMTNSAGANQISSGEIFFSEDASAGMKLRYNGSSNQMFITGRVSNTDTDIMAIERTGKVGIGTTSPQNKLNVIGDINATTDIWARGYNLTAGYLYATNGSYYPLNNPYGYINSTTLPQSVNGSGVSGYLARWNGTTSLNNSLIYQNGNGIGIDTTNVTAKLRVNGTFLVESSQSSIKLDSSGDVRIGI